MRPYLKYIIPTVIPLLIWLMPLSAFPFDGITIVQQRVIAIFLLAALCWVFEPIPIYATSVVIIVLELLLISNKGIVLFRTQEGQPHFGELLQYHEIMATFASPIIMLFLGGFFLAMAATKYRLDVNLARVLLKPFGQNPKFVMLGLMLITAIFSMFMSNTATTAMMLSILTPVIAVFGPKDPGRIAFALCIPVAANIGGIGTPIGTPPNAIALKYLVGDNLITFGEWMVFGVPFVVIMMALAWLLIGYLYKAEQTKIDLNIKSKFLKTPKAMIVYVTFAGTIILWLMGSAHGMNSYTVALIPVAVFSLTGIINKEDLKKISWDVLWLVSGGIALGLALDKTGLAKLVVHSIPFLDIFSIAVFILNLTPALVLYNVLFYMQISLFVLTFLIFSFVSVKTCFFALIWVFLILFLTFLNRCVYT